MTIKPIRDRVLLKAKAPETMTKGGLHIPLSAQNDITEAEVLAAGEGVWSEQGNFVPLSVKKGDKVLLNKYAIPTDKMKIDGEEVFIMREFDIYAVIE